MMRRHIGISIILGLLAVMSALMASCGRHSSQWQALERAAQIIDDVPDSALNLLREVSTDSLRNGEERARYNLLMTYAMYKNDYVLTSDSMINIALEYYGKRKHSHEYMLSKFCEAEIAYNNGDSERAMNANLQSLETAKERKEYFYQAKNAQAIAFLFQLTHNYAEMQKFAAEATESFIKAGHNRHALFTSVDYAYAVLNNGDPERAKAILDSIQNLDN